MDRGRSSGGRGCSAAVMAESDRAQVRAVAFKIEDTVYEGKPGETHGALYKHLWRDRIVSERTLDVWTACEEDHGFVTRTGEFLDRVEAFRRFGIARSQDLTAQSSANA